MILWTDLKTLLSINAVFIIAAAAMNEPQDLVQRWALPKVVFQTASALDGSLLEHMAADGKLEYLKAAHQAGFQLDQTLPIAAARSGQLDVLRYLHSVHCEFDEGAATVAAGAGHLEVRGCVSRGLGGKRFCWDLWCRLLYMLNIQLLS